MAKTESILVRRVPVQKKNKLKKIAKGKIGGSVNTEILNAINCYLVVCNHGLDTSITFKAPENKTP